MKQSAPGLQSQTPSGRRRGCSSHPNTTLLDQYISTAAPQHQLIVITQQEAWQHRRPSNG
jgi:hypothetical protein